MNFERTNTKISLLEDYYEHFDEDHRLKTRHGNVEFITNMKYILKYMKKGVKVIDIGAGTGAYSIYLKNAGYEVCAVELVKHNIDILKSHDPEFNVIQGNALNLSMFKDNTFDYAILFGPIYHLLKEDEKIKVLSEAKRIVKNNGLIFISYYMNDYAIITYGFIKNHIKDAINEGRVDDNYHMIPLDGDLYSMVTLTDINHYNKLLGFKRKKIIASDGASNYLRVTLNSLNDEEYQEFINYHLSTCERKDLLGASSHLLDIVEVIK